MIKITVLNNVIGLAGTAFLVLHSELRAKLSSEAPCVLTHSLTTVGLRAHGVTAHTSSAAPTAVRHVASVFAARSRVQFPQGARGT